MTRVDSSTTLGVQRSLIGGELVPSTTGETFTTIHPGTNAVICEVEQAGQREVDAAVASAREGFQVWSAMAAMERSRILRRAVQIIRERNDELAALDTLDAGRPIAETCSPSH